MVYPLPSSSSPQKNCALSIIYPGRVAEDAGHDVNFWDARLDEENELWENVRHAEVVAINSLSGFQISESIRIVKKCREKFAQKPIVWGGVHVTFQPVQALREDFVDFVIVGEGELRFPKLIAAIETRRGFKDTCICMSQKRLLFNFDGQRFNIWWPVKNPILSRHDEWNR